MARDMVVRPPPASNLPPARTPADLVSSPCLTSDCALHTMLGPAPAPGERVTRSGVVACPSFDRGVAPSFQPCLDGQWNRVFLEWGRSSWRESAPLWIRVFEGRLRVVAVGIVAVLVTGAVLLT